MRPYLLLGAAAALGVIVFVVEAGHARTIPIEALTLVQEHAQAAPAGTTTSVETAGSASAEDISAVRGVARRAGRRAGRRAAHRFYSIQDTPVVEADLPSPHVAP